MLWIPAGVGLFVFAMQMTALGESGSVDNPYNPLYAIFLAMWGVMWYVRARARMRASRAVVCTSGALRRDRDGWKVVSMRSRNLVGREAEARRETTGMD